MQHAHVTSVRDMSYIHIQHLFGSKNVIVRVQKKAGDAFLPALGRSCQRGKRKLRDSKIGLTTWWRKRRMEMTRLEVSV